MNTVDRTCPACKADRGILQEVRFYDVDAIRGTTDRKYPLPSGGLLNKRLICGEEACLKKVMAERKTKLENANASN